MATGAGGTIQCDAKGEIKVADILAFINKLILNSGQGYTKKEADDRFVNVTGDYMSGSLTMKSGAKINLNGTWIEGKQITGGATKIFQSGKEVLDADTGLKKREPGDVRLFSRSKQYIAVSSSGMDFMSSMTGTFKVKGHTIWHAGNSKPINTRLNGNTLYMTDNLTTP